MRKADLTAASVVKVKVTSSRARERPLPKAKFPNAPQPLRSLEFPLGLPTVKPDSVDGIKLRKANALYKFCRISWEPATFEPDKSCRILFSHASGVKGGGDQNGVPDQKRVKTGHSLSDSQTPKTHLSGCPSLLRH